MINMAFKDKRYDRARKWIAKNMDPKKYKTLQDMMDDVFNKPGFENIKDQKTFRSQTELGSYSDDFTFKTRQELEDYIISEEKRIEEARKEFEIMMQNLEKIKTAEGSGDINNAVSERAVKKQKEPVVEDSFVVSTAKKVVSAVGNFFGRLFRRKKR